ncbi:MAG: acylneuraminate cytidylyltransferase family protein [Lachnospiraceae bacterium]|nr:acylneuraminate cytidylyltransferase family protein [Lachnospiraceae bacterium]
MNRIAIIPARSGSKGLKDKNIRVMNGKPLMAYTIDCAKESGVFDKVLVSTDSTKYSEIAKQCGAEVPFLRSERNSGDQAGSWDVVREVLDKLAENGEKYDEVMLLQVTSPLRRAEDIIKSIELLHEKGCDSVVSLTECDHSPIWCNTLPEDHNMDNFENKQYANLPRQSIPTYYRYNGAIYLVKQEVLYRDDMFGKGCYAYIMPQERSVDIDTELDFMIAEVLINNLER